MDRKKKFFSMSLLSVLVIFLTLWVGQVQCQDKYPTRAIEIIFPFSPGGGGDLALRVAASFLNKKWGVPVNIINKPGGNTLPACLEVYNATPDGYTFLGDSNPSSSMLPAAARNLPFKIMDRTFIAVFSVTPMVLMAPSSSPHNTLADVIADAKKDPGNFTWLSLGGAGAQDFTARQLFKKIGLDVLKTRPVMVTGGTGPIAMTIGGYVKLGLSTAATAIPAINAKTVKPLAITSKTRDIDLPNVPTTAELGYPTVKMLYWVGISGPPKLPPHIIDKWDKAMQEISKDSEFIAKLRNIGATSFYSNSRETIKFITEEMEEVNTLWNLK